MGDQQPATIDKRPLRVRSLERRGDRGLVPPGRPGHTGRNVVSVIRLWHLPFSLIRRVGLGLVWEQLDGVVERPTKVKWVCKNSNKECEILVIMEPGVKGISIKKRLTCWARSIGWRCSWSKPYSKRGSSSELEGHAENPVKLGHAFCRVNAESAS